MSTKTFDLFAQKQSSVASLENTSRFQSLETDDMVESISNLFGLLQNPDQRVVNTAKMSLIQLAPESVIPLVKKYNQCIDQNVQALIIQILANIGNDQALDLLVEVVGVEVANHCQGNVRRVAARGLGKMVTGQTDNTQIREAVEKLIWALLNAEDWGLRYASALSLKEISNRNISEQICGEINNFLVLALSQESDPVVRMRINFLLN